MLIAKHPLDMFCHFWDGFYRPDDPTNHVKALKKASWYKTQHHTSKVIVPRELIWLEMKF